MNLAMLQRQFRSLLSDQLSATSTSAFQIKTSESFAREVRLNVYHFAFHARIKESLTEDFPRTLELLGKTAFDTAVQTFIQTNPSPFSSLAELSGEFPSFLNRVMPKHMPYLSELARLEWCQLLSEIGATRSAVNYQELTQLNATQLPTARLAIEPTVILFKSAWRLHTKDIAALPTCLMLKTDNKQQTLFDEMDITHWQILNDLQAGVALAEIFEIHEFAAAAGNEFSHLFEKWSRDGVIVGFYLENEKPNSKSDKTIS